MVKVANSQAVPDENEIDTEAVTIDGADELAEPVVEGEPVVTAEVDELSELSKALEEAQSQAAEYLDGWQRARAEFANYRRRQEQQKKQMEASAKAVVLTHLLPVVDDLERAFEAVPEELVDHAWVSGLSMVGQKWMTALEKVGLSAVTVEPGEAFDPTLHEALTHEPNNEFADGTVIQVIHRGYTLDGIVLRPALVRVSSGKAVE